MDALLGKVPDPVIAQKFNIPKQQVGIRRRLLDIEACRRREGTIEWTPEMDATLGKAPDPVIAKKYKMPAHQVLARRKLLGIKPCPKRTRKGTIE